MILFTPAPRSSIHWALAMPTETNSTSWSTDGGISPWRDCNSELLKKARRGIRFIAYFSQFSSWSYCTSTNPCGGRWSFSIIWGTGRRRADNRIPILSHSPSSPDLNRIEGCWRLVGQQLRMPDRRATSLDGLWVDIQRIRSDDHWTVDRMIGSMIVRREAASSVQGPATRW